MSEQIYPLAGKRVFVAGHRGMVGAALVRRLESEDCEIITATRDELDLIRQSEVEKWVADVRPQVVLIAAAKVGGIIANDTYPVDFLWNNMMIAGNLIKASHDNDVEKLTYLGSSCIYPKFAPQPIPEGALLTGELEPTNEWYAVAKIAGLKLCQAYRRQYGRDYISAMPTNLYGPGDNFDLTSSHVIPALMRKAHEAKSAKAASMEIWGSGTPRREFLHVDDCADAIVHLTQSYTGAEHVNVGSGMDVTIEELARTVMKVVGFEGDLTKDTSKPDGTPRKLMAADKIRSLGWAPSIPLEEGLESAYKWFLGNCA
ncbi:GDP-L-fucose synthase [Parvibaculaceae bacterium PLY_AMNH_Bact1]|nr:GDP-L-fucose synthase [Parvibaculaceae bacterium PLY_AMNH_Bact1]